MTVHERRRRIMGAGSGGIEVARDRCLRKKRRCEEGGNCRRKMVKARIGECIDFVITFHHSLRSGKRPTPPSASFSHPSIAFAPLSSAPPSLPSLPFSFASPLPPSFSLSSLLAFRALPFPRSEDASTRLLPLSFAYLPLISQISMSSH